MTRPAGDLTMYGAIAARLMEQGIADGPYAMELAELLEPIVWAFAAQELRRAASDAEESGRVYVYELTTWLRDRAGVMDGGERL